MSILIVGSILSVFILLAYLAEVNDYSEGLHVLAWAGIILTTVFGGGYTIFSDSSVEIVPIEVTVTKSPYKVYVDWTNYEGNEKTTEYFKHKQYIEIDSSTQWKAVIGTNAWGYSSCETNDIIYENK
jgi:hypothetical protein